MFSYEIRKELACEMIEYIENYGIQGMYLCDITNNLYNNDYYIIGTYNAKKWLKKYLELPNGIPSHDTIQRVISILDSKVLYENCLKYFIDFSFIYNN